MEFFTLASSSAGNCAFIKGGDTTLLIDAGISAARIEKELLAHGEEPVRISGILLTHEHTDHIAGVQRLALKYGIPVYASPKTWAALPFADNLPAYLKHDYTYDMRLGDFGIEFCKTAHDAVQPVGMVLEAEGRRLGYVTDTGSTTRGMLHTLQKLDALVLEANHDRNMLAGGPYAPQLKRRVAGANGHFANEQAAELARRLLAGGMFRLVLAHLSETNNRPELAYQAVLPAVADFTDSPADWLSVAPAQQASSVMVL